MTYRMSSLLLGMLVCGVGDGEAQELGDELGDAAGDVIRVWSAPLRPDAGDLPPLAAVLGAGLLVGALDERALRDAGLGFAAANLGTTVPRTVLSRVVGRLRPEAEAGPYDFAPGAFHDWMRRSFRAAMPATSWRALRTGTSGSISARWSRPSGALLRPAAPALRSARRVVAYGRQR